MINTSDTRLITRGFSANFMNPDLPHPRTHAWNFTLEKEVMQREVLKCCKPEGSMSDTLFLIGPTGIGKTWLARAFAQKACRDLLLPLEGLGHSAQPHGAQFLDGRL